MRKIFCLILLLINPMIVFASEKTYNDTVKIIQEVMKDYYIRGPLVQYHNPRRTTASPEEATSQDTHYMVCSGYVYDVYSEALEMIDLPKTSDKLIEAARDYYNSNKGNTKKLDGNYLLYYENTKDGNKVKYAYNNKTKFSDFVNLIQPGDIFVFTGHAMMAYGVFTRENGKKDVLLLNSNAKDEIMSRITYGTKKLSFSYRPVVNKNNIVDVDVEGGIQYKWLSDFSSRFVETYIYDKNEDTSVHNETYLNCSKKQLRYYSWDEQSNKYVAKAPRCTDDKGYIGAKTVNNYWVDCKTMTLYHTISSGNNDKIGSCSSLVDKVFDNELMCQMDECIVIRPYYKKNSNEVEFNYPISENQYNKSTVRLNYPGLFIEKIVNKGDNNSVYPNDELEYTIKIINKSASLANGKKNYGSFTVEEIIDSNVDFISANNNGVIDNNRIKWNISKLNSDSKIELKYVVRVKNNVSKTITSKGLLYNPTNSKNKDLLSISTGTVSNYIIPSVQSPKNSYEACYNKNKNSKKGLALVDSIYDCARGKNYSFSTFDFEKLFSKRAKDSNQIYFNSKPDAQTKKFQEMILNNYWGGISIVKNNGYQIVPMLFNSTKRKATFSDIDFRDGDVLIYSIDYDKGVYNPYDPKNRVINKSSERKTNEKGVYAYIYLNGKFVGVNGSGTTKRNEFTYQYYGNNISTNLYSNISNLGSNKDYYLKIINYNTLLDKDYYVILRPEIVIAEEELSKAVKGDVNGDGKVEPIDYKKVRLHCLSSPKLTGEELKRADVNNDGEVDAADYKAIRRIILPQEEQY